MWRRLGVSIKHNLRAAVLTAVGILCLSIPAFSQFTPVELPDGDVETALTLMNQEQQPQIGRILNNYSLTLSPTVKNSLDFSAGEVLRLDSWKTTARRLNESKGFSDIALALERSIDGKTYNALIQTSKKSTSTGGILLGLAKGLPVKTSYLDIWNLAGAPVHSTSRYRWDSNRQRAESKLLVAVPVPGSLLLEIGGLWRSEQWELSDQNPYRFNSSGVRVRARRIQHHTLEIGGGIEYSNRAGASDVGSFLAGVRIRPLDGKYKSQIHVDGFVARASVLGDVDYSGATLALMNRFIVSEDTGVVVDWAVKGGTTQGRLPIEDYFILGVDGETPYLLRGHVAFDQGRYGRSPMGTDFFLINSDIERRLWKLPLVKDAEIKAELFLDGAKVFDRNRVFRQAGWFLDGGVAARIQLPGTDLVLLYGRSLNHGTGVLTGYIEHRFW